MKSLSENSDFWSSIWDDIEKKYSEKDGSRDIFESEIDTIKEALFAIKEEIKYNYTFKSFIDRGGAGLVFEIEDKNLDQLRALKIPRPLDPELIETVENEKVLLRNLMHRNIMPIFNLGNVNLGEKAKYKTYPYFIMKFMKEKLNLRKKIKQETLKSYQNEEERLEQIMVIVLKFFYQIAKAIQFLHMHDVIHFDVKPQNILIDTESNDNPLITDLGYAKQISNKEEDPVIGFTFTYAHPSLILWAREKKSISRTKIRLTPKEEHKKYDIYTFGKSLLEILKILNRKFSTKVGYNHTFMYLHLAACRMLDGENKSNTVKEAYDEEAIKFYRPDDFYNEEWLELSNLDFKGIKYRNFQEIVLDFEKIIYNRQFTILIPELNSFHHERIQSSYNVPAPFSKRVALLLEHPLVARLKYTLQLGLLENIYPTATHNRLEHSIGAFRNCSLYIQSLYNDPFNPLFKQLVNEKDLKAVLLAAILHDLGHYPLAHEIWDAIDMYPKKDNLEPDYESLKHENLTLNLLDSQIKSFTSQKTLKDIIEIDWGVELDYLKNILRGYYIENEKEKTNLKIQMLNSIIDGPIDVDKLDFLQRDSHNCYLRYGDLIDEDRLIRTLTIIIKKDEDQEDKKVFTIGVYERGQSAAESFAFARYLLYQSLYWHRTARSIRSMIAEAVIPAVLSRSRKTPEILQFFKKEEDIESERKLVTEILNKWTLQKLKDFIKEQQLKVPSNLNKAETIDKILEELKDFSILTQKVGTIISFDSFYKQLLFLIENHKKLSIDDILTLIEQRTKENGKILINMVRERRFYKRIFTIHRGKESKEKIFYNNFAIKVRNLKEDFQIKLTQKIKEAYSYLLPEERKKSDSLSLNEISANKVIEALNNPNSIISDSPEPNPGGKELLRLIPEPNRLRQNLDTRVDLGGRISGIYHKIYEKLMIHASKGRLFCHPDIRDRLLSVLSPTIIKKCINETIDEM